MMATRGQKSADTSAPNLQLSGDERFSRLAPYELAWQSKQPFLQARGYMLRPRYRPGWTPSWRITGDHPLDCEDGVPFGAYANVIDAIRISDGKLVTIKCVRSGSLELQIASMLRTPPLDEDPTNHCVPILDIFGDSKDATTTYLAMPFLRDYDNPRFERVEDVLDFGEQLLEGLAFMHEHGIAHRDCTSANIMMDASPLYPRGFHPIYKSSLPDGRGLAWPMSRSLRPVKYYFIDYSISAYIPPDMHPKVCVGIFGRDREPPELSDTVPYDPFKLDVFILGNVFRRDFCDKYDNVGFLSPIAQAMTHGDSAERPSAVEALQQWRRARQKIPYVQRRWRLRRRDESSVAGLCNDYFYLMTLAVHWFTGSQYTDNVFQD